MRVGHLAVSVLAVLLAAGCGSPPSTSSTATQALRVCSTGDYRPFTYRDAQGWSGMDIDLAQSLADNLGRKLELVQTTWSGLLADVGTKCDMAMGGISITAEREKQALYSAPYLKDGKAAIVRCTDSAKYHTLSDIDKPGVRVVVNPGGSNEQFDKANIRTASVITYPDNNTIFGQVANGDADVMITDASEIRWETKQDPKLCGVSVDTPFTTEQKAYLFPRSDPGLQKRVDVWLHDAQSDGTYGRVSEQWLGGIATP